MLRRTSSGSFAKTKAFLERARHRRIFSCLHAQGRAGVNALSRATPVDTGRAASSWGYQVEMGRGRYSISWYNTDVENGANVAILLQYGHGLRGGGFVEGIDYINPAIRPIFDKIQAEVWREVTK